LSDERLAGPLQESVLTLLCFDDQEGRIAAGLVTPDLFEETYKDVATSILAYHQQFHKAPGKSHIDDILGHVLGDPQHKRYEMYRRIVAGLFDLAEGLNAPFVLSKVNEFIRQQNLKKTVLAAAEMLQSGDASADEIDKVLYDGVKFHADTQDSGVFLGDKVRGMRFLEHSSDEMTYKVGIPQLDRRGIGPAAGEMLLFVAPRKRGKSWWMIHCGVQTLLQKARIVHITLEMSEQRVVQRYYQNIFAIAKRADKYDQTVLELDGTKMIGLKREVREPILALSDKGLADKLSQRIDEWGTRLNRLVVKQFPTGALTLGQLDSYLDGLALSHKFIPTVIIIDYPDLMKLDSKEYRLSLGRLYERLRGVGVERNAAMVVASQSSADDSRVAEDISKIATADNVIHYKQTNDERVLGLARLLVSHARNDEDRFSILISQDYRSGQFVKQSALMDSSYFDMVKAEVGVRDDSPSGDEE